jgi:hypothetical protein
VENAALAAENEQMRKELAALKAEEAPASQPVKRQMPASEGTTVSYPRPDSTLIMPSDGDLHRLMDIALAAFPSLAPKIELSFQQRLTVRNIPSLADQIEPDALVGPPCTLE